MAAVIQLLEVPPASNLTRLLWLLLLLLLRSILLSLQLLLLLLRGETNATAALQI